MKNSLGACRLRLTPRAGGELTLLLANTEPSGEEKTTRLPGLPGQTNPLPDYRPLVEHVSSIHVPHYTQIHIVIFIFSYECVCVYVYKVENGARYWCRSIALCSCSTLRVNRTLAAEYDLRVGLRCVTLLPFKLPSARTWDHAYPRVRGLLVLHKRGATWKLAARSTDLWTIFFFFSRRYLLSGR